MPALRETYLAQGLWETGAESMILYFISGFLIGAAFGIFIERATR